MPGLLDDAIAFYRELEEHNTKEWWERHRARYDSSILPTFRAICDGITGVGSFRVYRPHNDTRFDRGRPPYKTFVGGVAERADGVGVFVQVSSRGVLLGTGMPMPAADQLPRLRSAIAEKDSGEAFVDAIGRCEERGVVVHAGRWEPLRRAPRGFPSDHGRAEWLRWKGVETNTRVAAPDWTTVDEAVAALERRIAAAEPVDGWLGRHVGPSELTPEERFAPKRR